MLSVGLLLSQIFLSNKDLQYFLMVFSEAFQYLKQLLKTGVNN